MHWWTAQHLLEAPLTPARLPTLMRSGTQALHAISGLGHCMHATRSLPRPLAASAAAASRCCCASIFRRPASPAPSASATACMSCQTPARSAAAQCTTRGA